MPVGMYPPGSATGWRFGGGSGSIMSTVHIHIQFPSQINYCLFWFSITCRKVVYVLVNFLVDTAETSKRKTSAWVMMHISTGIMSVALKGVYACEHLLLFQD